MSATKRQPRNLLAFADGSWARGDSSGGSHVWDLHRNLAREGQLSFYDPGVGTGRFKFTGGILGWGMHRNVLDLYAWICKTYEPGDRIFLAGWSRGAHTVRTVAGLIAHSGLAYESDIHDAWEAYRTREKYTKITRTESIHGLLCFDTVDAYLSPLKPRWKDHNVSNRVLSAFHLVAMHERRKAFKPVPMHGQQVQNVQFLGNHGQIGGGIVDGLSEIAYQASGSYLQSRGVHMRDGWQDGLRPDPQADIAKASGWWRIAGLEDREPQPGATYHQSVLARSV